MEPEDFETTIEDLEHQIEYLDSVKCQQWAEDMLSIGGFCYSDPEEFDQLKLSLKILVSVMKHKGYGPNDTFMYMRDGLLSEEFQSPKTYVTFEPPKKGFRAKKR